MKCFVIKLSLIFAVIKLLIKSAYQHIITSAN